MQIMFKKLHLWVSSCLHSANMVVWIFGDQTTVPPLCSFLSICIKTSLLFSPVDREIERLITASNLFHHLILNMGLTLG